MSRTPPPRLPSGGRIDRDAADRLLASTAARSRASPATRWPRRCWPTASRLVGRSFKYHRPRGLLSRRRRGAQRAADARRAAARREPNMPATMTELVEGSSRETPEPLAVGRLRSAGASTSWRRRCSPAGFYYKTFMGPTRGAWMFYEPLHPPRRRPGRGHLRARSRPLRDAPRLRRRAGHRRRPGRPRPRRSPPGAAGARVALAEQDALLGGSLLAEPVDGAGRRLARRAPGRARRAAQRRGS